METLKKFKQFVDEINLENGRNYKLSVLEKYKDDEVIKKYLQYVFDPFIIFGISDKKIERAHHLDSQVWGPKAIRKDSVIDLIEYIKENNTGKDEVLATIEAFKTFYFAPEYDEDEQLYVDLEELFDKIICKNLILGISSSTINKAFGKNTIHEFSVQLANKYFDDPTKVEGKEFALTTKIDGMRCIMMKENGNVTFWSRQGQPIEGLVDLIEEAKKCFEDDIVLDGELVANVDNIEDTYKQTIRRARTKDAEKHNLKMMIFDCLSIEEFKTQTCKDCYEIRRDNLMVYFTRHNTEHYWNINKTLPVDMYHNRRTEWRNLIYSEINKEYKYFELLPILYQGRDVNKIDEILKEQVANGEEGIMINIVDAPYEFKRSNSLLKCKLFSDTEVKIIGFQEGTNSFKGKLGALICEYKGNILKVGSGFTDTDIYDTFGNLVKKDERKEIWNHQDEYLGQYAKVKYFEETTNANGGVSLRFPTYLGLREKGDM